MNEGIIFLNREWAWPLLLGGLLLWAVFLWKEFPWSTRARGRINGAVSLLALAALVVLALEPALPKEGSGGKGILIGQGHDPRQLDSLRAQYKGIPVETYIPGQRPALLAEIDSLFILGHGPEAYDHWQFEGLAVQFLGGISPTGLVDIAHPPGRYLGEELRVRAVVQDPGKGQWALLRGPGGHALDSVALEAGKEQYLALSTRPKAQGLFVYSLEVRDSVGNGLAQEPIPVEIRGRQTLDILIVEEFPSFEGKYLKNFLAQRGHRLLVRSRLTQGRYKFDHINRAAAPFLHFSPARLKEFDLILMDTGSYLGLDRSSRTALGTVLRENGGGLLILPGEPLFLGGTGTSPFLFTKDGSTEVPWAGETQKLEKYPYAFQKDFPLQPIYVDGTEIAAYLPWEKGRIATTLIKDTYTWLLKGKREPYERLWTGILDAALPEQGAWAHWQALDPLPRVDVPFGFQLVTPLGEPSVRTAEGEGIPLIQDQGLPDHWQGRVYPKEAGWNALELPGDSLDVFSYYVYGAAERVAMGGREKLAANTARYGAGKGFTVVGRSGAREFVPISPYWFFMPLLLAWGWLWLEPKLRGG